MFHLLGITLNISPKIIQRLNARACIMNDRLMICLTVATKRESTEFPIINTVLYTDTSLFCDVPATHVLLFFVIAYIATSLNRESNQT